MFPTVPEYKLRCHAVWLIAVHNLSTLATHFSPHESAVSDTYDLAFDRTFVFNAIRKEAIEIRAQQAVHTADSRAGASASGS